MVRGFKGVNFFFFVGVKFCKFLGVGIGFVLGSWD